MKKITLIASLIIFLAVSFEIQAVSVGESQSFYVQPNYDLAQRKELTAILLNFSSRSYFYIDQEIWHSLDYQRQNQVKGKFSELLREFENNIYPKLTSTFGEEWTPGIDKDPRITILVHSMPEKYGGYFYSGDEYPQIQVADSNEKEMVYLNFKHIESENAKSYLANEFMHMIDFYQKEKKNNVTEEVWLNELRSEYAPTLLGYTNLSLGNILRERIETFLNNPINALCQWENKNEDYGIISLFGHYLADIYGIEILRDSLQSEKTGIESLNYALKKNGFEKDFSQIFTDWTSAILVNDCGFGEEYCYKNEYLKNIKVSPRLNYLPQNAKSSLVITDSTKNWAGNWYKFVGGEGDLKIRFIGSSENKYKLPYLINDFSGNQEIKFFELSTEGKGEVLIEDFGTNIISVVLMPSLQTKTSSFSPEDISIPFFLEASTIKTPAVSISFEKPVGEMSKEEVLEKISEIEEILASLKKKLAEITSSEESSEFNFQEDLFYGLTGSWKVEKLQEFLKNQGQDIYPEALVTGNFLGLTRSAVIRFQEKYAEDILEPLGLKKGTGFVGPITREKIREILGY
jgi:hypothetical protein